MRRISCQSRRANRIALLVFRVFCATVLDLLIFINYSLIAQSVERRTVNPQVAGSSPARGANIGSINAGLRAYAFKPVFVVAVM